MGKLTRVLAATAALLLCIGLLISPASAAVTIRNSGIQSSSAASYTVNWPSGTVAGDMAIVHYGGGFALTSIPSGWSTLYVSNQGNWNGTVIWKILNSTDISNGHITLTPTGTFNSTVGIVTVQTGTFDATATPTIQGIADVGGSSTRSVQGFVPSTSDLAIYFGSARANGAVTVNLGSQQQTISASNASASIYTENPGSIGPNPTFSFAVTGPGDTTFIVGVQDSRTLPAWLRGSAVTFATASTVAVTWPTGTVSGDVDVIFTAGLLATTPSGWTSLYSCSCANWEANTFYKTLNSTDISNGGVTITFNGSFQNVAAQAVVTSTALSGYASPVATMTQNASGATSRTVNYTSTTTSDYALYWGANRSNGTTTINLGTYREGYLDGVGGGALYVGQPASVGTISPTFSYSAGGGGGTHGDSQGTVLFAAPAVTNHPKLMMHSFPP